MLAHRNEAGDENGALEPADLADDNNSIELVEDDRKHADWAQVDPSLALPTLKSSAANEPKETHLASNLDQYDTSKLLYLSTPHAESAQLPAQTFNSANFLTAKEEYKSAQALHADELQLAAAQAAAAATVTSATAPAKP